MSVELATIFARFAAQYRETLPMSPDQQRVLRAVLSCRTPVLGVQRQRCDHCGFEALHYCSCRNRHCPKCQGAVRAQWVQDRVEDVLEVPYFHLVFTLPHELNGLARGNPRLLYSLLFEVAWYTLDTLARERLGGQLGMTAVLHTWGQTLSEHIHLHCLIPGGAFNDRHGRWQRARSRFLFPVNVMRRVFRGRFVSQLRQAHADLPLAATDLTALLDVLMRKDWTIYAKPVLGHPQQVLDYLGRYTYRIAIGHERLLAIRDDQVWFRYRDYRCGGQDKVMALAGTEFMRRFLSHVVPRGFMRVRHYGFLGNRVRPAAHHAHQSSVAASAGASITSISRVAVPSALSALSARLATSAAAHAANAATGRSRQFLSDRCVLRTCALGSHRCRSRTISARRICVP